MAEAAVATNRFFCHNCSTHFGLNSNDLICPHCESGFVEELENNGENQGSPFPTDAETREGTTNASASLLDLLQGSLMHYWPTAEQSFEDHGEGVSSFHISFQPISSSGMSAQNGANSSNGNSGGARPRTGHYNLRSSRREGPSTSNTNESVDANLSRNEFLENFMQQLLNGTTPSSMFGATATVRGANPAMGDMQSFTLHGNPNDYAWGANGLDNIITQLLGQLDSSGAPPASEDAISKLPTFDLTKEQVQAKKDCSVCMEAFVVKDRAKQLPCTHIFHIGCIEPWLKLHNTCPICRTDIETPGCRENSTTNASDSNAPTTSGSSTNGVYYASGQ